MSSRIATTYDGGTDTALTRTSWWAHLIWIGVAAVVGFLVAAIFAGMFEMSRTAFVLPHLVLSGGLVYVYLHWSGLDLLAMSRRHWLWGLVGGVLAGAFLVSNVLSQPASDVSTGLQLLFDLVWLGVIYGTVDALLLSVLPIAATWQAFTKLGWMGNWPGRVVVGALALVFSLIVTAAYHLGYAEFQGPEVVGPIIGNGASSLAYLLTGNPIGALISHIAMHVASVLHGPETTVQLPPHYW